MIKPGRLRKGKACARPEDEETAFEFPPLSLLGERLNRPLIRQPLYLRPSWEGNSWYPTAVNPPPNANLVDKEFVDSIKEASLGGSAEFLRRLFCTLLSSNTLSEPEFVWNNTWHLLSDDILYRGRKNVGHNGK